MLCSSWRQILGETKRNWAQGLKTHQDFERCCECFSVFFLSLILKDFSLHQCSVSLCEVVATIFVKPCFWGLLTFEREFAFLLSVDVFVSSLKTKKKNGPNVHDLCYPSLERFRVTFTANVTFKLGISQNRK